MDTSIAKIASTPENWENGVLGQSIDHAKPAPTELEKAVDESLGFETVELRVSKNLVEQYERLTSAQGFSSPKVLMRKALQDFVTAHLG